MTLCDLSPFYCETGGGIRTFHRARLDWFSRQTRHRYVLVAPGPQFSIERPAPHVWLVRVYGVPTSRDPDRYRCLVDYPSIRAFIEQVRPDVLEAHDPFFSLPYALWLRRRGSPIVKVTSFCHAEAIGTYVAPYAPRAVASLAARGLSYLQRQCDATFVASESMRTRLVQRGVGNVVKVGFGLDPACLETRQRRAGSRTRLLYVGRLDRDKECGLLLDVMPRILRHAGVRLTVVGTGRYQERMKAVRHPRFRYLGFLTDRRTLGAVYAAHDVLLAPGRFETFGLAALEAAAAGLVVVGPDEGGTGELLRQMGSHLTFRAGDRERFLDRIDAAIGSDTTGLVERGRAVAAAHGTWSDAVARHVAIFESMLGDDVNAHALGRPA